MGGCAFTVTYRSDRLVLAARGPVFVNAWNGSPDLADVRALEGGQRDAIARGLCLNLAWIHPAMLSALPDADVRARTRALLLELGPSIAANAQVIDVGGFTGAAIRAFLTSLGVLTRPPHPTKVCASVEEGLEWLARRPEAHAAMLDDVPGLAAGVRSVATSPPIAIAS